jgi:Sec63 Brl domain
LRSGEKSFYKQINKDIGMKFPILVDIALPAHKVSLLLQAELGGVECPVGEQFVKHKNQFQQDKAMIFQHVNRLVRCVIDCELIRGDSGSARHALELARSFAARVWDNSPLQLKQLDQIGNVAVRKLASAGINSIESLENAEAHRIETIIGRGPPFGMKLLSKLAQFPKLRVLVKMAGKEMKPQRYIKIRLKAEIGFLNESIPSFFRRRPIYVCFLAETSDGQIVDFRRIPASKLQNGHEILLSAELTKPSQYVSCHVMCDEIAGTCRSAELRPNLPASLFPISTEQKEGELSGRSSNKDLSCGRLQEAGRKRKRSEDFNDGELDDGDMLAAESVETMDIDVFENELASLPSRKHQLNYKKSGNSKKQRGDEDGGEPIRLTNGKWACNHKCKDKVNCKHMCCRDGLDKPPKPAKKSISGKIEEHLPIPSMLDVINNTPSKGDSGSKKSSSDGSQTQYRPTPATKETRSLIRLHEATTPTAPTPMLRSSGVKVQMEKTNLQQYSTSADASSKTKYQNPFDEDVFDSDWANDIDAKDLSDSQNLRDSSKEASETLMTTGPIDNSSQNNPLLDVNDSQFELDENDASMLEASLVGLEDSIRLNEGPTRGQKEGKDLDANTSVSSGVVRGSRSSWADRWQAEVPFDCNNGSNDLEQEELDSPDRIAPNSPHAGEDERVQNPSCGSEPSTSPSKKRFFTSPKRGKFAPTDAPSDETAWQKRHEAEMAAPKVNSLAPPQEASNDRTVDRIFDKSEDRIGEENGRADDDAARKKREEEEQKLWKDGIDPLFYDEFKDIVEFI